MNALEIRDLCKSYPGFSLQNLNLTLPQGCIMGLIGENGAGKSTTIKLILEMVRRDSGSIRIFGKDNTENISLIKEDIGVVLDEVGFPECLTVKQIGNIMKILIATGIQSHIKSMFANSHCRRIKNLRISHAV